MTVPVRTPKDWTGPSQQVASWNDFVRLFSAESRNTLTLAVPVDDAAYPAQGPHGYAHIGTLGAATADYVLGASDVPVTGTTAFAVDVLRAVPFVFDHGFPISMLSFSVTTGGAAGSVARMGIYSSVSDQTGNLYPGTLLKDAGQFTTTAAAFRSLTTTLALTPHRVYWAVYNCGVNAPTISSVPVASLTPLLGMVQANVPNGTTYLSKASAYAALPGTFPTGAAEQTGVAPAMFAQFGSTIVNTGTQRRVVAMPYFADAYLLKRVRMVKSAAMSKTVATARGVRVRALLTTQGAVTATDEQVGYWDSGDSALLASLPKTISASEAIDRKITTANTLQIETTYRGWQPLNMKDAAVLFDVGRL